MNPLWSSLKAELARREKDHLRRHLKSLPGGFLDLSSNDYLGLARHPEVVRAAQDAAAAFGAGARASRLVSGDTPLHRELEAELAAFKGTKAALVFPSGYAANLGVITSLATPETALFCQKRNHASLIDACRLAEQAGAKLRFYDRPDKLQKLLAAAVGATRRLIVTDGVFSMDGDIAPLVEITSLTERYECTVILDDAHGTGTLGPGGRGVTEHFGIMSDQIVHVGTLSKALGSQGGFVAGPQVLIDYLVNTARSFIYTTGLNPPAAGAALQALRILRREPERVLTLARLGVQLRAKLQEMGFTVLEGETPILAIIAGSSEEALAWSEKLKEQGLWCPAIRPPTVATPRLRMTVNAGWGDGEVERVLGGFEVITRGR